MKTALRITLAPVMLAIRLMLGLAAFITSIASSVLGISVSLFALLSVIEFFIGYWQNGIAFMVLAFLASPIGLPAIANLLLNLLDHLFGFFEGLYYSAIKILLIQLRLVMLIIVSLVRWLMVSHRRSTTFSKEANISLQKPLARSSFQICSIGFISGV